MAAKKRVWGRNDWEGWAPSGRGGELRSRAQNETELSWLPDAGLVRLRTVPLHQSRQQLPVAST